MKVGYLWQIEDAEINTTSTSVLHITAVISGLKKRLHQVRFVTTPDKELSYTDDWEDWHKVPLGFFDSKLYKLVRGGIGFLQGKLRLPYFHFFDSMRYGHVVTTACKDYDVLFERYWLLNYGGLIAAKRLGVPLILEINGDLFQEYEMMGIELSALQWRVVRFINRKLFKHADHVVTVSDPLRTKMIKMWDLPEDKVTAIDNGAHVDRFAADYDLTDLRAKYQLNGEPTAVFVGTFRLWHGLDLVIEAFKKAAKKDDSFRLLLIGDGPQYDEIQKLVGEYGLTDKVVFTGKVKHEDVAPIMKLAQVALVNPRLSPASAAQSPLKLFEYMAGGKAVIAPDVPNIQKIMTHGEHGLLIPPNDADHLAEAMYTLLSDQATSQKMGNVAQEKALAEFSWDKTVERIEDIMVDLIAKKQRK